MMQTPTLFDSQAASAAADMAIGQVDENASEHFRTAAEAAVGWCAQHFASFTSDDVWARMETSGGVPETPDNRALGGVFRAAAAEGLIAATDTVRPSSRIRLHGSPRRVWRSMVFAGSGPAEGSVGLDPADDRETG